MHCCEPWLEYCEAEEEDKEEAESSGQGEENKEKRKKLPAWLRMLMGACVRMF